LTRKFNEKSQVTISVRPVNKEGVLFTPTTARYRMDDLHSRTEKVAWATLTPSTKMTITIPGSSNDIINSGNKFEDKIVTVQLDQGLTSEHNQDYKYRVTNLEFIP